LAEAVNAKRRQSLAGTRFPEDEDGDVRRRHLSDAFLGLSQDTAFADEPSPTGCTAGVECVG
jgi:hypothetical protein